MSFLGMGVLEILVILLVAFIFLGPERMMDAARFLARAVREGRNLASSIPRVVVEDDDVKIVEGGRTTSLTKQDDEEREGDADGAPGDPAPADGNGAAPSSRAASGESAESSDSATPSASDDGGPVPFSRRRSPSPPPPAPGDENER